VVADPHTPIPALSVRQPWAWLIVLGYKDVENRTWRTRYRGPLLIHAAKTMLRQDYVECALFARAAGLRLGRRICVPAIEELPRGGIVGQAFLSACVSRSCSPWFVGPWGWLLEEAGPLPFSPCRGSLGLFTVSSAPDREAAA